MQSENKLVNRHRHSYRHSIGIVGNKCLTSYSPKGIIAHKMNTTSACIDR